VAQGRVDAMTRRRWLAATSWIVTMTVAGIALGILIATRDTPVPTSWGFRGASEAFAVTCGTVGAVVALRRPANINGWLFCAIGLLFATEALVNEYVIAGLLVVPGGLPLAKELGWMLTWLWVPPLGIALIYLPLLFPTGSLLSPRWRPAAILGAVAITTFSLAMAFAPGPIQQATFLVNPLGAPGVGIETYSSVIVGFAVLPLAVAIAMGISSLILRFRRAREDARRQIKWFALAVLVAGAAFTLYLAVSVTGGWSTTVKALEILVIVSLMGLPTAAGMAILRYRLYDIDRIVSRTISYGLVTTLLVAVFLFVNLALQGLLSSITASNSWAVAASTLLVAALFTPVRRLIQRAVDRRFNRARYDAERMTAAFAERLRDQVDLPTVARELDATVQRAMAPTSIDLWLRRAGR